MSRFDTNEIIGDFRDFEARAERKFSDQRKRIDEDKKFLSGEQYDLDDDKLLSPKRSRQTVNIIANAVNSVVNAYSEYPYSWYTSDTEKDAVASAFLKRSGNARACDDALLNSVSFGVGYLSFGTTDEGGETVPALYSIPNPNDVIFDPDSTEIDGSDATEAAIIEIKSKQWVKRNYSEAFARAGGRDAVSVPCSYDSEHVPLVTYYKLTGGKVQVAKILGGEVLEDESDVMDISRLPIIPVYGERTYSKDDLIYQGLVRKSKSLQKLTNMAFTQLAERLALSPKSIFVATDEAIEGKEDYYKDFHKTSNPLLEYNAHNEDGEAVEKPTVMNSQVQFGDVTAIIENNLQLMQTVTGVQSSGIPDDKTEITATEALLNAKSFANNVRHYYKNLKESFRAAGGVFFAMLGESVSVEVLQGPDEMMQKQTARQELQTLIPLMDDATKAKAISAVMLTFSDNAYMNSLYAQINNPQPTQREKELEALAKQMRDAMTAKDQEILQLTSDNEELKRQSESMDKSAQLSLLLEQEKTRREIALKQMDAAQGDADRQAEIYRTMMSEQAEDQRTAARLDAEAGRAALKAQADVAKEAAKNGVMTEVTDVSRI